MFYTWIDNGNALQDILCDNGLLLKVLYLSFEYWRFSIPQRLFFISLLVWISRITIPLCFPKQLITGLGSNTFFSDELLLEDTVT